MDRVRIISLSGLAVIFLGIYLSVRRNREKPKYPAAERLFEAFVDEIQDLSRAEGDAYEILKPALPKHEKAYVQFRPYLNGEVLRKFDEAWKEYSCQGRKNPQPFLEKHFAPGNETLARGKRRTNDRFNLHGLDSSIFLGQHLAYQSL